MTERLARLSWFFPAHNEEANLEGLVDEALGTLPHLAETFEIVIVDDGSRDRTGR
ncbi:MAG TPA: glycosyltransferase, partial [Candidatus Bathyarchaeia archaeon]|nr:glycosyltransferase [Candidatus Bathyarchaeia archaeon]